VAVEEPRGLSTQNILPAQLRGIAAIPDSAEVFLRLAVGPTALIACITEDSVARLQLRPGARVWALVKAVTFDQRIVAAPQQEARQRGPVPGVHGHDDTTPAGHP
jgi:molybdate transport system ATP-binding protein